MSAAAVGPDGGPLRPGQDGADGDAESQSRWSHGNLARLLSSASALQVIDLKDNHLSSIPPEVFSSFEAARVLDLRKNSLNDLPEEVGKCVGLEDLYLDQNRLTKLPKAIGSLVKLHTLCVSQNVLENIPPLQSLTSLKTLHLGDNRIKQIPDLSKLTNLKAMFVHHNHFTQLPSGIEKLTNLAECALEWFRYAQPALPRVLKGSEGKPIIERLRTLSAKNNGRGLTFSQVVTQFSAGDTNLHTLDSKKRSRIHIAALEGHTGVTIALIEAKVSAESLDTDKYSPLLVAVREEHVDIVKVLVESNVNVNDGGGLFGSPLHVATAAFDEKVVRVLVSAKANTNCTDVDGNSPLHVLFSVFDKGARWSDLIGDILLGHSADPNSLNSDGWAPLHLASRRGQFGALQFALAHNERQGKGFDLNLRGGSHWWTCLHLSGHACHVNIVQQLLEAGAEVFIRNIDGRSARHVSRGNLAISKMIRKAEEEWLWYRVHSQKPKAVDNGFNPPPRDGRGEPEMNGLSNGYRSSIRGKSMETQLLPAEFAQISAHNFNHAIPDFLVFMKQLLTEPAYRLQVLMLHPWAIEEMKSDKRDDEGNSVFLLLCDAGDGDAIRALTVRLTAEERASLALIENTAKETVLHVLAKRTEKSPATPHRADIASFLLTVCSGLRLEAPDERGFTPLHWAALKGDLALVQVLLSAEADVNAREQTTGWSPLHCAVSEGHCDIMLQLIHADADVNVGDSYDWTPLFEAASKLDASSVGLLIAGGAHRAAPPNEHDFDLLRAIDTSKKDLAAKRWFTCLVVANGASSAGVEGLSKQDDDNLKIARRHFESSSKATNVPPFNVPSFLAPRCMECKVILTSANRTTCRSCGIAICSTCATIFASSIMVLDHVDRAKRGNTSFADKTAELQDVTSRDINLCSQCIGFYQYGIGSVYTMISL
jgi:ankyrin repeat protein